MASTKKKKQKDEYLEGIKCRENKAAITHSALRSLTKKEKRGKFGK